MCVVLLQVTLYGAGPGSLDIGAEPGLVRSGIFNTVGTCSAVRCQYTTTQPCQQKNSAGGETSHSGFHVLCYVGMVASCFGLTATFECTGGGKVP